MTQRYQENQKSVNGVAFPWSNLVPLQAPSVAKKELLESDDR